MAVAALIADFDKQTSDFAIHGACPKGCYDNFRSLANIYRSGLTYAACVLRPSGDILHRKLPVLIGSSLDCSIRKDADHYGNTLGENGIIIVGGHPNVVNSFLGNNTRTLFKYSSSEPCDLFDEDVFEYVKIPFTSLYGETVMVYYNSTQGFLTTSSHARIMNGEKQTSPVRRNWVKDEVVHNFDLQLFLDEQNDVRLRSDTIALKDVAALCADVQDEPVGIDSQRGNKLFSTPGRNFRDILCFYDVTLCSDQRRLFRDGSQYTPHYKGEALHKSVSKVVVNQKNLALAMETGTFQDKLVRLRFPMVDRTDEKIPAHNQRKKISATSVVSNYDALPGQKHDKMEDAVHRCKRAHSSSEKMNIAESSFPRDAEFFLCPGGAKEMKKAGSVVDLAHGAFISLETDQDTFLNWLRSWWNQSTGSYSVAIEWKLTGAKLTTVKDFVQSAKKNFPCITCRVLKRHLILYLKGGVPMKWSPTWNMFVSPVEAYSDHFRALFETEPFATLPFLSRLGPHSLALPFNAANMAANKIPVAINGIRGGALKPNAVNMESCSAYPGFNCFIDDKTKRSQTVNGVRFGEMKPWEFVDLTKQHVWEPRTHEEKKLVRNKRIRAFWEQMKAGRGKRTVLPHAENPNMCGFSKVEMWPGGKSDLENQYTALQTHMLVMPTARAIYPKDVLPWQDLDLTLYKSRMDTVLGTKHASQPQSPSKVEERGAFTLWDRSPHACTLMIRTLGKNDDKRCHAPHAVLNFAFADLHGGTNEDALILQKGLDNFRYQTLFTQYVRFKPKSGVYKDYQDSMQRVRFKSGGFKIDGTVVFGYIISPIQLIVNKKPIVRCCVHKRSNMYFYKLSIDCPPTVSSNDWKVSTKLVIPRVLRRVKKADLEQGFVKIQLVGEKKVGVGNKLSTVHGQKGIVIRDIPIVREMDASDFEAYKGVTEDGRIICPQILYSPTSYPGRSAVLQHIGSYNAEEYGVTANGGFVGQMGVILSSIVPEKGNKVSRPSLDLMTNAYGMSANDMPQTESHLGSFPLSMAQYTMQQFVQNGACLPTWGRLTETYPV